MKLSWILLCLLGVVLAIAVVILYQRHEDMTRFDYTNRQLIRFRNLLFNYGTVHGAIAAKDTQGAINLLLNDPEIKPHTNVLDHTMFLNNQDAWQQPFAYEWKNEGKLIVIRSIGANRQDDYGDKDDIQIRIELW